MSLRHHLRRLTSRLNTLLLPVASRTGRIPKAEITPFLPPNPVIVDAGAHVGVDTMEMAALWPDSRIFAFEPVPELFARLLGNAESYSNVQCFPSALGKHMARSPLRVSSGESDASSSLLPPSGHLTFHPHTHFTECIEVDVIALADFALMQKIEQIHFMWLDVQGYELEVLRGARHLLSTVCAIHLEVSLQPTYEGAPLYDEVKAFLSGHGFSVHREALPWPDMGNVLFVRR